MLILISKTVLAVEHARKNNHAHDKSQKTITHMKNVVAALCSLVHFCRIDSLICNIFTKCAQHNEKAQHATIRADTREHRSNRITCDAWPSLTSVQVCWPWFLRQTSTQRTLQSKKIVLERRLHANICVQAVGRGGCTQEEVWLDTFRVPCDGTGVHTHWAVFTPLARRCETRFSEDFWFLRSPPISDFYQKPEIAVTKNFRMDAWRWKIGSKTYQHTQQVCNFLEYSCCIDATGVVDGIDHKIILMSYIVDRRSTVILPSWIGIDARPNQWCMFPYR